MTYCNNFKNHISHCDMCHEPLSNVEWCDWCNKKRGKNMNFEDDIFLSGPAFRQRLSQEWHELRSSLSENGGSFAERHKIPLDVAKEAQQHYEKARISRGRAKNLLAYYMSFLVDESTLPELHELIDSIISAAVAEVKLEMILKEAKQK